MGSFGLFGRRGWSDAEGPLWFLRERWSVGPRWRSLWARFYAGDVGVTAQAVTKKGGYPVAGFFVPYDLWRDLDYRAKEDVLMGWIRDLRGGGAGPGPDRGCVDREWLQSYPALHEYLVERSDPNGAVRRTATLTVFADGPSWKVFLNDRHSGASLCASADSIGGALSALEVLLEAENTPWRFSDPPPRPEHRRGRKGS